MRTASGLLGQIFGDYRRLILALVVVGIVNIAIDALVIYPLSLKVSVSERRAATVTEQLRAARRDSDAVHATLTRTGQAEADLARFYKDVLPPDISGARRLTYARLAAMASEHNLTIVTRSYALDDSYKGRLKRLQIEMSINGEYPDLRDFVYAVETAPEFVVIENVGVGEGARAQGGLTVALRLATYFRAADDGR
jgi:Tfp pilus assembly protein PilO